MAKRSNGAWSAALLGGVLVAALAASGSKSTEEESEEEQALPPQAQPDPGSGVHKPGGSDDEYAKVGATVRDAVSAAVGYTVGAEALKDMALSVAIAWDATHNKTGFAMTPFLADIVNKSSPAWTPQDAALVTVGKLMDWAGRFFHEDTSKAAGPMDVAGTGANRLLVALIDRFEVEGGGPPEDAYEACFELPDFESYFLDPAEYTWSEYGVDLQKGAAMLAALMKVDSPDYCARFGEVLDLPPLAWWSELGKPSDLVLRVAQEVFYVNNLRAPSTWDEASAEIAFVQDSVVAA